ncbi:MAG: carboxypeptidase regulatory-like domain-containing protein [Candidatus Solibacter usitatus]|nr:carboxypeptidase regulatory-like domain-containing protein [Candidatus Solibacter usitatus]
MLSARFAAIYFVLLSSLAAQDFRATISGQVTDESGSAIPGAKVRAIQLSTNQVTEKTTNADGYFTLPYLMPSTYEIEVEAGGFSKFKKTNVALLVAEKLDMPITLKVGAVSEQITVTAESGEIQTADASRGLNFDSLMTSEYPLNGRQVYMLMDLTPGVLFTQEQFGSSGFSGTRGWDTNGSYVMNGGLSGTNSFSLNGAPISLTGSWQVAPNTDAIQEFKVMTNTYDAAIGRTGGGSVNTTLKSGSNKWRGSLANFMRNSVLDANITQNNRVGAPKGKHITNQYNGTLGGAIRKDKDFVFVSFEGFRERVPFPVVADVPPLDLRDGEHFTKYNMRISDPLTGRACVDRVDVTGTCASTFIRNPFPDNVIPASRISPVGVKILSFYPVPNTSGLTQNFVHSGSTGRYHYDQPMARWDRVFDNYNRLNVVFTYQHGQEYRNQTGIPGPAASGNMNSQRTNFNFVVNYTRLFTSKVFDLRMSFGRFTSYFPDADMSTGLTAKELGMTGVTRAPTSTTEFPPRLTIDQFSNLFGNGANLYTWGTDNQWNIAPSISMTKGTQTIKYGADLIYAMRGTGSIGQANGQLGFNRYGTQQYPLRGGNNTDGAGIADVLLGIPGTGIVDWNDTFYRTWPYYGVFIQDDWKVRRGLTVNIGLRYDVQVPWVERWDRVNNGFDLSSTNPLSDPALANWRRFKQIYDAANPRFPYPDVPSALIGGKTFVQSGGPRRTYLTDWQNIQPRVGVAWMIPGDKKMVMRAGFGIFHRTVTQNNLTDGFSQQTTYIRSTDGDITPSAGLTGPYSLQNPFPNGLVQPAGRSRGLLTSIGNGVSYDGAQRIVPRTFQYSFGLQRRMPWQMNLDVSYSGSMTTRDTSSFNMNYVNYDLFLQGQAVPNFLDRTVSNPFYGVLPLTSTFGAGATTAARNLYYPYPLFNGITVNTSPWARYRYDSLQLRMEKRFTGNRSTTGALTVIFSYTFAKNFSSSNRLNNWNLSEKPIHELVSYDKPQNIALSGVWDIPIGRNRHFFSGINKRWNTVVGGWNMSFSYRFTSGNPVNGIDATFSCETPFVDNQVPDRWFNNDKTCYRTRPSYTLRNVSDRYPWLRQMDNTTVNVAGAKMFSLDERWKLHLRAEAFNLLNHPLFGAPDTGFQNARFGMLPLTQQNFPRNIQASLRLTF